MKKQLLFILGILMIILTLASIAISPYIHSWNLSNKVTESGSTASVIFIDIIFVILTIIVWIKWDDET